MKILILGGTKYVGRLITEEAVRRGHQVTIFNRGSRSIPDGVTALIGDRLAPGGYAALDDLSFDVVIDTWADDASVVKSAVDALRGRIGQFIYISSIGVYNFEGCAPPFTEEVPLYDPATTDNKYAKDKVSGELRALESGVPTLLARAGVILGPHEALASGARLPWWLRRMEKGGPTLAPERKDLGLQFIDGRDLALFVIDAAETKLQGAFNLVSEMNHITMERFLEACNEVTGNHAKLLWLEKEALEKGNIKPWTEIPMWIAGEAENIYMSDVSKALRSGLKIRPARETIQDTWEWLKKQPREEPKIIPGRPPLGLDAEKESAVLKENFGDNP